MHRRIRITLVAENTALGGHLLAEHGLSWWIEIDGAHVLFDTGQGPVLAANAPSLHLPLDQVDAIVLSHGHYDHTGGLANVLGQNEAVTVYMHPDAPAPKYAVSNGQAREIGMPQRCRESLESQTVRTVATTGPTTIFDTLIATGPIERVHDIEDVGGPFFLDPEGRQPDPLIDDQALYLPTDEGTIVLLGCAHAGVINTLHFIRQLTGGAPIRMVLGGMHLVSASAARISWTIQQLRQLAVEVVSPLHCTGFVAAASLWQAMPDQFQYRSVGSRFTIEL